MFLRQLPAHIIGGVIEGQRNHATFVTSLEVTPAAVIACALTYFIVLLAALIARRVRNH